jgi:hypothetical protein
MDAFQATEDRDGHVSLLEGRITTEYHHQDQNQYRGGRYSLPVPLPNHSEPFRSHDKDTRSNSSGSSYCCASNTSCEVECTGTVYRDYDVNAGQASVSSREQNDVRNNESAEEAVRSRVTSLDLADCSIIWSYHTHKRLPQPLPQAPTATAIFPVPASASPFFTSPPVPVPASASVCSYYGNDDIMNRVLQSHAEELVSSYNSDYHYVDDSNHEHSSPIPTSTLNRADYDACGTGSDTTKSGGNIDRVGARCNFTVPVGGIVCLSVLRDWSTRGILVALVADKAHNRYEVTVIIY